MVPEPPAICNISPEEKEKASAVAALAANNFDEDNLSPTKVLSPTNDLPIVQPLELPENGTELGQNDASSLDNITIPELPEDLNTLDKDNDKETPVVLSLPETVAKVGYHSCSFSRNVISRLNA